MGYEIDFLPVGDESSGGDAIALRYGNLYGQRSEQTVIVIDGGYTANGEALVDHIGRYYGTDRVDIAVSTHTDQDHITELEVVLKEMEPSNAARQARSTFQELVRKMAAAAAKLVPETLTYETLRDDGETSATNNSSVISLLMVDGDQLLFTGDAGIPALELAVAVLEAEGFQPGGLGFVQVPHHGSRRNVGPSVLNRLLGPKGQTTRHSTAFASVPKKNPEHKHPAKKVTNAFRRRGYDVHLTQGATKWHRNDAPARDNYFTSTPVPFHEVVEEDGD